MNESNDPPNANKSGGNRRRGNARATSNPGVEPRRSSRLGNEQSKPISPEAAARAARPVSYSNQYSTTTNKETAMQCNKTTTGLSLLGGAGIGAALMYMLDPEQGERRRAEAAEAARHAAESTGAALAAGFEVAKEKGHALTATLGEYGAAGAETAGGLTSRLMDRAGDTGRSLRDSSRHYTRSARHSIGGMGSPRSWFGREEERSYVPSTGTVVSAAACLAAGFGLMYMLDPQQGRRRRHVARDKTMKWLREFGDMSRKTGRHLANKSKGWAHETRKAARDMTGGMTGGEGFGRSLADRVRSRLGTLGRGRNVNVDCDDFGRVTLLGDCAPDEVAILITEIQAIPGVDSIDNRIGARTGAGAGFGQ